MAKAPAPAPYDNKYAKECQRRLKLAVTEKELFNPTFAEVYQFCMPYRVRPGTNSKTPPMDASDLFTSIGMEMATDFSSEITDTFMPEHQPWCQSDLASSIADQLDDDQQDEIRKQIKADDKIVADAMSGSNLYDAARVAFKDVSVSAAGLFAIDPGAGEPFHCQAIPLTELFILRGGRGGIGTRLWKRDLSVDEIEEAFPGVQLPAKIAAKREKKAKVCVVQGCWADFSVAAEHAWVNVTMFDDELVDARRNVGRGACSILVARWDPSPDFAWGTGPGIAALSDYRTLDEICYLGLKGEARRIDPPFAYDDDGIMNFEDGLPNGVGIPRASGSAIQVIESSQSPQEGYVSQSDIEHRIRRKYYLDEPQQEGKTPPTLGQWMDETMRRQRRLATPAAPLWPEFLAEVYYRFRYLLVQRGTLKSGITVGNQVIPLKPINPLKRAAQQEEFAASERFMGSVQAMFGPVVARRAIKLAPTLKRLHEQSHATGIDLRDEGELTQLEKNINQAEAVQAAADAAGTAAPAAQAAQGILA